MVDLETYRVYHHYPAPASLSQLQACRTQLWHINGDTYVGVASLRAASPQDAYYTMIPTAARERFRRATDVQRASLMRVTQAGDVLVGATGAWMIQADGSLEKIPYHSEPLLTLSHAHDPTCLSWSPDGDLLAVSTGRREVLLLSRTKPEEHSYQVPSYDRHEYGASAVAWSPDGRRIASGGAFGEVHVWTAEYREKHYAAQGSIMICRKESHPSYEMKLAGVCWSPDGTRLFAGRHDGWVVCWNTTTGACLLEACRNISIKVNDLSLSPDGTCMAVACQNGEVRVWAAEEPVQGREVVYRGHRKEACSLSWSPDGRMIVSCSSKDEMIHFWDPLTGNPVNQVPLSVYYRHPEPMPRVVRWSPDGAFVAVGCEDGTVQLIASQQQAQVETIWAYTTPVRCLAWSGDGRFLATGSWCANGQPDVYLWGVPPIAPGR